MLRIAKQKWFNKNSIYTKKIHWREQREKNDFQREKN